MNGKRVLVCGAVAFAAMGAALRAHHSTAVYQDTSIVLKGGTMKSLFWGNPHTILTFDVKDASGSITTWSAESGSATSLSRIGWTRNSVKAGDAVTVELFPARNGARVGRLAKVILADGRELLDSLSRAAEP